MLQIIVVAVCLVLNALFACFEMAFVTAKQPDLQARAARGSRAARALLRQRENPERTLSVVQIGITLVGMVSAAVGGAGAEESIAPILEARFRISEASAEALSIALVVLPLTYLSVVLGELVPKSIALRYPSAVAIGGAPWSALAEKALRPFVWLLEVSTRIVLGALFFFSRKEPLADPPAFDLEALSPQAQGYVLNLAAVERRKVGEVMRDWKEVITVDTEDSAAAVRARVLESGHTRVPVTNAREVVGLIHGKELFALLETGEKNWRTILRPIVVLQEADPALRALRQLQNQRSHLGVVYSARKEPVGIVTIDAVLEGIVGELLDEDDDGELRRLFARRGRLSSLLRR